MQFASISSIDSGLMISVSLLRSKIYSEFIVVENNSTEKETFEYYDSVQKQYDNVRVVKWEKEYNLRSAI